MIGIVICTATMSKINGLTKTGEIASGTLSCHCLASAMEMTSKEILRNASKLDKHLFSNVRVNIKVCPMTLEIQSNALFGDGREPHGESPLLSLTPRMIHLF